MPKKNKSGRPQSSLDLAPGWDRRILNIFLTGGTNIEVKAMIYKERGSFSNDLWNRWLKEEPEFSEIIKKGKALAKAWWLTEGRANLKNKDFNYTGWYMQMKNRFKWADKQEVKHSGSITLADLFKAE